MPKQKMHAPSTLRPILTAQSATPKKAIVAKLPPSNLSGLAPKAGLGDPRRISFQPAQKLDPKQLKTVVRRWYRFDKCGRMSIIEVRHRRWAHTHRLPTCTQSPRRPADSMGNSRAEQIGICDHFSQPGTRLEICAGAVRGRLVPPVSALQCMAMGSPLHMP